MKDLYGVLGDPIAHSISPEMHNDAFRDNKMNAHYHAFQVSSERLADAVKGMNALGVRGFNVTIPHKTAIMPYLDRIDPLAKVIGAVNTVKLEDGLFVGYNTDGRGFVNGLKESLSAPLSSLNCLIIGAGGAARAIYYTLVEQGIGSITVCNRTVEKAEKLTEDHPDAEERRVIRLDEAEKGLQQYDLVINTTSIGMKPDTEAMPIALDKLKASAFVSDIIYNPLETTFLKTARQKGAAIQNGLPMFIHQGAQAFEIWTGIKPDTSRMKRIVLEKLGG